MQGRLAYAVKVSQGNCLYIPIPSRLPCVLPQNWFPNCLSFCAKDNCQLIRAENWVLNWLCICTNWVRIRIEAGSAKLPLSNLPLLLCGCACPLVVLFLSPQTIVESPCVWHHRQTETQFIFGVFLGYTLPRGRSATQRIEMPLILCFVYLKEFLFP